MLNLEENRNYDLHDMSKSADSNNKIEVKLEQGNMKQCCKT